jgi:predicted ATP-dependent endonuclease of OLD family
MSGELFFKNLKDVYSVSFENFKLVSQQQKKFVEFWLAQQPEPFKTNMKKAFDEWCSNIDKSMNDFKDVVFKGIDYMEEAIKKNS